MAASHQTHHAQVQSLAISQDETLLVRINVMKFYLLSKNNSRSALEDLKTSLWFVLWGNQQKNHILNYNLTI